MKCIKCDKELKKGSIYCDTCGTNQNEKIKKNHKLLWIILIIILLITIGTIFVIFNNSSSNNDNTNIELKEDEINFYNHVLKVPKGFNYYSDGKVRYIKSNECTIEFEKYPIDLKSIKDNKELLIYNLKKQDYEIKEFKEEDDFILVSATLNEKEYGLVFYTIDNDVTIYLKIVSNNLTRFNNNWFKSAKEFVNNNI